jgi:hypothetical protein
MVSVLPTALHGSETVYSCGNKLKCMAKERDKKHFRVKENEIKGTEKSIHEETS